MKSILNASITLIFLFLFISQSYAQTNAATPVYVCPPCPKDCHAQSWSAPGDCPVCGMALIHQDSIKNVAIFLYNGVEILDFSGPGEVFAAAKGFHVYTVAVSKEPIISQGFVKISPSYSIEDCPRPSIIVLPGGSTRSSIENPKVIEWVKAHLEEGDYRLSVCTGAFILEKAGLLKGKKATTWHGAIAHLKEKASDFEVLENTRWVDNGNIITTAGVSAGIDGALHLVEKIYGIEAAKKTARYMEYDKWNPEDGVIIKAKH